jgi:acetyl esterase/lipase
MIASALMLTRQLCTKTSWVPCPRLCVGMASNSPCPRKAVGMAPEGSGEFLCKTVAHRIGGALCAALLLNSIATAGDAEFAKETHTYKTVGETAIQADVFRFRDTKVRPVVVWIHGGALLFGGRSDIPRKIVDMCRTDGFVLVSLDYRFAPEVKLPAIVDDIQDAFRWLRSEGPKKFSIDPDKVVVSGGSAGGYLTLMTGIRVEPRPKALVSYWGYGDVDGDWLTKPSPFFRSHMPVRSPEEAFRAVGHGVVTNTEVDPAKQKARVQFFYHLRQNGRWAKEVTGFDPQTEGRKFDSYCPVRNVTSEYPPTILIHGTDDNDVPVDKSEAMAAELTRHNVPHELIVVRGAGHGLGGGDKKLVADAHERALAFIRKYLK